MKRCCLVLLLGLLSVVGSSPARAQFCPICGTNPCRDIARKKGITLVEPPSPHLSPAEAAAAAGVANRLLTGAVGLKDKAYWKLFNARPVELLNTLDQLSQSHEELKNPTTVEGWARAVQVDALWGIIQDVSFGVLGTVQSVGAKIVSTTNSWSAPIQGGTPSKSRLEQFFGILDNLIGQATGQSTAPKPPPCGVGEGGSEPLQADSEARATREKLLYGFLSGYNEAGLYYQSLEFKRLAEQRWGAVADPALRAKVEALGQAALKATSSDIVQARFGDPIQPPRQFSLEAGKTGVLNFKAMALSTQGSRASVYLELNPTNKNFNWKNRLTLTLSGLDKATISVKISSSNLEIPITIANNLGSFNALKLKFESTSELLRRGVALQGGALTISLNGQEVATLAIPLPNSSTPIGADGNFVLPVETLTTGYRLDCFAGGGDGATVGFQYSVR